MTKMSLASLRALVAPCTLEVAVEAARLCLPPAGDLDADGKASVAEAWCILDAVLPKDIDPSRCIDNARGVRYAPIDFHEVAIEPEQESEADPSDMSVLTEDGIRLPNAVEMAELRAAEEPRQEEDRAIRAKGKAFWWHYFRTEGFSELQLLHYGSTEEHVMDALDAFAMSLDLVLENGGDLGIMRERRKAIQCIARLSPAVLDGSIPSVVVDSVINEWRRGEWRQGDHDLT